MKVRFLVFVLGTIVLGIASTQAKASVSCLVAVINSAPDANGNVYSCTLYKCTNGESGYSCGYLNNALNENPMLKPSGAEGQLAGVESLKVNGRVLNLSWSPLFPARLTSASLVATKKEEPHTGM